MRNEKRILTALLTVSAAFCLAACEITVQTADNSSAAETTAVSTETTDTSETTTTASAETTGTTVSASAAATDSTTTASAAITTTATAASTVTTTETKAPETTTAPDASGRDAMSEQDLEFYARRYYGRRTNYSPQYADVEKKGNGEAVIHLYDLVDNHTASYDWYTVNVFTGEGTDFREEKISIKDDSFEMWFPEDWCYNTGKLASVLYIGKMDSSTELNQKSLQTLIDNTTGAREYVNHYPYVNEIPDHNMISTQGGEAVFMVIPGDSEAKIQIDSAALGEEDGRVLFRSYSGQPLIIRCNAADKNDFSVTITDHAGKHPYFSMWYAEDKNEIQFLDGKNLESLNYPFD